MGFDLRYNFINTFRSVDAWRNNIVLNMQGALAPGFKQRRTHMGLNQASFDFDPGAPATANRGGRAPLQLSAGELAIQRTALQFRQDPLKNAEGNFAHMAIQGNGFFAVAESLNPGARVLLTRDGSFNWKPFAYKDENGNDKVRYQLVNSQGLFVLRSSDIDGEKTSPNFMKVRQLYPKGTDLGNGPLPDSVTGPPGMVGDRDGIITQNANPQDPTQGSPAANRLKGVPTFQTNEKGQEVLVNPANGETSQLAIVRVPNQSDLNISSFGATVYNFSLNTLAGTTLQSLGEWRTNNKLALKLPGDELVLGNRIEQPDPQSAILLATLENQTADFVFKNLSTMLQEYNNAQDQLLNLIR